MKWTNDDVTFLTKNYTKGAKYCAETMNRTITTVRRKAFELGLSGQLLERKGYNESTLREAVKICRTIKDVLITLGLRAAGGNYKTINKYIEQLNLDTSHFFSKEENAKHMMKNFVPLTYEQIFCIDSIVKRATVKRYLFKHGMKNRICELCGQDEMWHGKQLSLILDHINGVYNDNRIENLQIVCPNCNATLDTHCGKNKK
jgi:HNH endonuclease